MDYNAWLRTATGKQFFILDPWSSEICIEDIATSLSKQCRFNGHLKTPQYDDHIYSVAQHSVYVLRLVQMMGWDDAAKYALVHDFPEYVLGDLISPVKVNCKDYQDIEDGLSAATLVHFNVFNNQYIRNKVHVADKALFYAESAELQDHTKKYYPDDSETVIFSLYDIDPDFEPWGPARAKQKFLHAYRELFGY